MGNVNRKATGNDLADATQVIGEAFPEYEVVWGAMGTMVAAARLAITRCRSGSGISGASITQMSSGSIRLACRASMSHGSERW